MSHTQSIKRGDLVPSFLAELTNTDDAGVTLPVDLSTALQVRVRAWRSNLALFDRVVTPSTEDAQAGIVRMPWQAGDTSVVADLYIEVNVVWPTSKPQTFPPDGWMVVAVTESFAP